MKTLLRHKYNVPITEPKLKQTATAQPVMIHAITPDFPYHSFGLEYPVEQSATTTNLSSMRLGAR